MKRILFIAPSSYPVNGAEAIVNIKLLRALSECGEFAIDLVSKTHKWQNYPTNESLEDLRIKLESYTTISVDNKMSLRVVWEHLLAFLFFGVTFKGAHWAYKALGTVKSLVKGKKYDYIITKDSPSILLGLYLKKKYNVKWVATWNDPYPMNMYPFPYGSGNQNKRGIIDRKLIRIMKKYPDIHIFPSDRLKNYMNFYLKLPESKLHVIPHVVFRNKFIEPNYSQTTLKLIHSGNLCSPRNPATFINAFSRFIKEHPSAKIEFHILGVLDKNVTFMVENEGLSKYIKILPPVSYSESLALLRNYQIAVIIEANCAEGVFMPTKVSDFMENKIRIFSVSPSCGVLNDLYSSSHIPYFAPVENTSAIYEQICKAYGDFVAGKFSRCIEYSNPDFYQDNIVDIYKSF